ncbi:MAG: prepilin-type N-terminal cleavage/methylation domain-containing protein [Lysobacteraceae bacterium]|nr:MAG: prepilin-type N-terminal cleavage/methylation domain-containing protein [Xanthomonadaceae bacterium]
MDQQRKLLGRPQGGQVRPVSAVCAARRAGFTLVEAMIALAVFATLLAIGVPRMSDWLAANKAAAANQFYAEAFTLARAKALTHNSASRLVLSANTVSGQYDWRVDLCFPTPEAPCDADGTWSTLTNAVNREGAAGAGFTSVSGNADALPETSRMSVTIGPDEASAVYFTPLGWVDPRIAPRLTRIDLAPAAGAAATFRPASVVLTLAGVAAICDPDAAANDSRRCPE